MAPPPDDALLLGALSAQWDLLVAAFAGLDPAAPTRCAGWTVRDLESHLAATTRSLARLVHSPEPPTGLALTGLAGWAAALPGLAADVDAEVREAAATTGPGALAEAVEGARVALVGADPDRLVQQRTGVHRLRDALRFRLIEGTVHGLDAGLAPDGTALRLVTRSFMEILVSVAPGRSVEVRVPPHAAAQCVEGPRHTRGTPPNTVEADPVTFLEVVTGRLTWADGVRVGRIRASGARADLSGLLPLLR